MAQAQACNYDYTHAYTIRGSEFTFELKRREDADAEDPTLEGLVQQFSLSVSRQSRLIYGIGSQDVYRVEAPPQGQLQLAKVLAPAVTAGKTFLDCSCEATDITLTTGSSVCGDAGSSLPLSPLTIVARNVYQDSFTLQCAVTDSVISAGVAYSFTHLDSQ